MRPGGILALDVALLSGWAYGCVGDDPVGGTWVLPQANGQLGERYIALDNELTTALIVLQPVLVVMAPALLVQQKGLRFTLGLVAHVESACARQEVVLREASESTARKHVLGAGRFESSTATKAAGMSWAVRAGYRPVDHNHADALVMWRYACDHAGELIRARIAA